MKNILKFTIIFVIIFTNFSCRRIKTTDEKLDIFHVPLTGDISTLDPASSYDVISATIIYQALETLYEYHYLKRPYTIQPLLADGLPKIENNGKRYIVKIKKNIAFHDDPAFGGKPRFLVAQDFINQIKRLAFLGTKSSGWWLFDGKIKGLNKFRKEAGTDLNKFETTSVEGLTAKDPHTLVIDLITPYPQMLYSLAMSFTTPVPIELIRTYKNNLHENLIGTGPFKLKSNKPLTVVLEKNEAYHGGTFPRTGDRRANRLNLLADAGKKIPFLDQIKFHVIKEEQTRWLNFRKSKIDFLILPKDNYSSAINSSGEINKKLSEESILLQVAPTLTYWWLAFNMKDPLVGANVNLRKGIAHAIDIEKYIKVFTNNVAQKANSIFPPGTPGYDPSREYPFSYNPEKAKEYLKKAGYPNGVGLPILSYDVRGTNTTNRQQAGFIKQELSKVGIKIKVLTNTFPAFLEKARNGKLQFWQGGWAMDYPDAENSLQLLISKNHPPGPNSSSYSNPRFDQLYDRLKILPDNGEKRRIMLEMENIIFEDLPWVMQYYARNNILYHQGLKNFRYSDLIYNYMKYIRFDRD
jgi:oligopeptide transport system substrate-binding protein